MLYLFPVLKTLETGDYRRVEIQTHSESERQTLVSLFEEAGFPVRADEGNGQVLVGITDEQEHEAKTILEKGRQA